VIAKASNLMYSLNVQVTAYRRQTISDRGVVIQADGWMDTRRQYIPH